MSRQIVRGVIVDHVGIVCADVQAAVARFRGLGYTVSDPVPLMAEGANGEAVPLGQDSAHIVFENGYIELSAPWRDFGNHLDPYLAQGPGVRILCFRSHDLDADFHRLGSLGMAASPVQRSSRVIAIEGWDEIARFRWVSIRADFWPGVLVALVEHLTPDLVFSPALARHANGVKDLLQVVAGAGAPAIDALRAAFPCAGTGPQLIVDSAAAGRPLPGLVLTGENAAMTHEEGYYVRTLSGSDTY